MSLPFLLLQVRPYSGGALLEQISGRPTFQVKRVSFWMHCSFEVS